MIRTPLRTLWLAVAALVAVAGCNPLESDGLTTEPTRMVRVRIALHQDGAGVAANALGAEPSIHALGADPVRHIGASLIIAVSAGTVATARFENLPEESVLARALLDPSTSTVDLTLPIGTSIGLLEYTFNDALTLEDILATTPVAGPPNLSTLFTIEESDESLDVTLPILTYSFGEEFDGPLNELFWEEVGGGATSSGGALTLNADGAFIPGAAVDVLRIGEITRVRTNRNVPLTNQRVSGTMGVQSVTIANTPTTAPLDELTADVQVRATAGELIYRPRGFRGAPNNGGLSLARIMLRGRAGERLQAALEFITCKGDDPTCARPGQDLFLNEPFSTRLPLVSTGLPSAGYPFSLEYLGDGVFKGTFNGETQVLNAFTSDRSAFYDANPEFKFTQNDFLAVQMRAQGMNLWEEGDRAAVVTFHDNVTIGAHGPAAPGGTGAMLADALDSYDDYSAARINLNRWNQGREVVELRDGRLVVAAGGQLEGPHRAGPVAAYQGNLVGIAADVTLRDTTTFGSADSTNKDEEYNAAGLVAEFYNTASVSPVDRRGNVRAALAYYEEVGGGLVINAFIEECLDANCDETETLVDEGLAQATRGTARRLEMTFVAPATFVFTVDGASTSIPAPLPPLGAAFGGLAQLAVETGAGPDGFVAATFDNLAIDTGAGFASHDNFDAGVFNAARWRSGEVVREIRDGRLALSHFKGSGSNSELGLSMTNPSAVTALAADVTVTAVGEGNQSNAAGSRARVEGLFYNDGRGTGNEDDLTGDVFAAVEMREHVVQWRVLACDTPSCNAATPYTNPQLNSLGTIEPGSTHTLYLAWDAAARTFTFQLDDLAPKVFDPIAAGKTVAGPPSRPLRRLRVEAEGEGRLLRATFDNVRASIPETDGSEFLVTVTVTGLEGSLELSNNGADALAITADGAHTFATTVASGATYTVTVSGQPDGQVCTVNQGSGTVGEADVTGITVTCVTGNTPPVANAGPNVNALALLPVNITGGAATDADGDPLTYQWTFKTKPAGSNLTNNDILGRTTLAPSFTPDVPGVYELQLVVSDGEEAGTPDIVVVTVSVNQAPQANAGADQSAAPGEEVTLDGSGSTDANGSPLTYLWTFSDIPPGSTLTDDDIVGSGAAIAHFTPDEAGTYVLTLEVGDGLLFSVDDVEITVIAPNSPPVAVVGPDFPAVVNDFADLNGSASFDPEDEPLGYAWSFASIPGGSNLTDSDLFDANSAFPYFIPDVAGTYVVELIVNDGTQDSPPDPVTITAYDDNLPPDAYPGPNQNLLLGDTVVLDASESADPDGEPLTYQWSLVFVPAGSALTTADLDDPTGEVIQFDPDVVGDYVLKLLVSDGVFDSAIATASVSAFTGNVPPVAVAEAPGFAPLSLTINLDGSASFDYESDALTFSWTFLGAAEGSALDDTDLINSSTPFPFFQPDVEGLYIVQLTVTDAQGNDGSNLHGTAQVFIFVLDNEPPIADAGASLTVTAGIATSLDGSGSSDTESDPLSFVWDFLSVPGGSSVDVFSFDDSFAESPSFTPDVDGVYTATLVVFDGFFVSLPDTVVITVSGNAPPTADAGPDQLVATGQQAQLDGNGSTDGQGPITYQWSFASVPGGSALTDGNIGDALTATPFITPDVDGVYTLQVTVNDGQYQSNDTVDVTATSAIPTYTANGLGFSDNDFDAGEVEGNVDISMASDESNISDYVLYWGESTSTKCSGEPNPIAVIGKTGADLLHNIPPDTIIPSGCPFFIVFTANPVGEMATGFGLPISDN